MDAEQRIIANRFASIRMDSPVPSLESASASSQEQPVASNKRKATRDEEEEGEGSSNSSYTYIRDDAWIHGREVDDKEDEENPIQEDEKDTTDPDFCWACAMASFQDKNPMATYWLERIMPLFQIVDERYAVLTIRDTYNRLVRPRMDPKIKQRWTARNIWKHMRFHQTDVGQMLAHSVRKVSRIMEQAERELIVVKDNKKTLNVDAAKVYFDGTRLLHKLLPSKKDGKRSSNKLVFK